MTVSVEALNDDEHPAGSPDFQERLHPLLVGLLFDVETQGLGYRLADPVIGLMVFSPFPLGDALLRSDCEIAPNNDPTIGWS